MRTMKYSPSVLLLGALGVLLVSFPVAGNKAVAANGPAARHRSIERSVTDLLREQGLGPESRILVLAPGNRVFLLGVVPDMHSRTLAGRTAQQVRGVRQVENFLVARAAELNKTDTQLEQDIRSGLDRLRGSTIRDVRPQAANGTVVLQGRVDNWLDVARAVQTAFIAGADYVVSQLSVDAGQIRIDVNEGVATLRGTVDSFGGMVAVVDSAFHGGARTVRNQLQVVRSSNPQRSRNMPTDESAEL